MKRFVDCLQSVLSYLITVTELAQFSNLDILKCQHSKLEDIELEDKETERL